MVAQQVISLHSSAKGVGIHPRMYTDITYTHQTDISG